MWKDTMEIGIIRDFAHHFERFPPTHFKDNKDLASKKSVITRGKLNYLIQ